MQSETHILAWQGWSLEVPVAWNPVRVEGDADSGSMLLADLAAARLGIRWRSARRKAFERGYEIDKRSGDSESFSNALIAAECGLIHPSLHRDPESRREIFTAFSQHRERLLEIVYTPEDNGPGLRSILATFAEQPAEDEQFWSVFGLHVRTPPKFKLQSYAFNAGDVALHFRHGNSRTIIRRVGPAKLALSRQPIEKWATTLDRSQRKLYRSARLVGPASADRLAAPSSLTSDGPLKRTLQENDAVTAMITRRRRLFWAWFVPRQLTSIAAVDPVSDRVIVGSSNDSALLHRLVEQAMANDAPISIAPAEQQELLTA